MPKSNKPEKIINQIRFIKDQMQDLVVKIEELDLFDRANELDELINKYSLFADKANKEIVSS